MENLCDMCMYDFATCIAKAIVFGIDNDPNVTGEEADAVLECASYWNIHSIGEK